MRLMIQIDDSCLVYAAAMVLDVDPNTLIAEIGHDGQDIWWPACTGASRKRGIHIQEIIDCAHARGHGLMPIEVFPCSSPGPGIEPIEIWKDGHCHARFENMIAFHPGILIGESENGIGHAWAWDGEKVYDPRGYICKLDDCAIRECWLLC